ncbi:MAG: YhdP family protein [Gammaproteobacteria bacterium]
MPNRILKFLYHFAVYAIGISVLFAAIGVTIIRLLLPDIGMYRGEIEAWVSQYMDYPVAIRSLDARWEGWIPQLYLTDIELLNQEGTETITRFDNARISIAPIATLLQRQIVPRHLLVSGFDLSILRRPDGSIYLQGISLDERPYSADRKSELAEWLFRQNRIEINNGTVEWIDARHDQDPVPLKEVHILLRTDRNRIQLEGSARLPGIYGDRLNFAFDGYGNLMTSDWSGDLYLEGKNINPDNWYRQYRPFEFNISGGAADIRIWSIWDNAQLENLQGQLRYADFNASVGDKSLHINNLDYEFLGERKNDQDWRFRINLNDLMTEYGGWPESRLEITAEPVADGNNYKYSARFSYLKLEDLVPLLGNLSLLPERTRSVIKDMDMRGDLIDGEIHYQPEAATAQYFGYDIRFNKFSARSGENGVRIIELSGHTTGTLDNGIINFRDDTAKLHLPAVQNEAIPITAINGNLEWQRNADGFSIHSPLLSLTNSEITTRVTGTALFDQTASPFLDMVVEMGQADLEKLRTYVPYTPGFKMRPWMEKTVLGGNLISASALIRGYLSDFPYRESNGRFKLIANIDNGVYEYSDQWPIVDNLNTEVVINAMELSAHINQGKVYDATFDNGRVFIPDLFQKQKNIFVDGKVIGNIEDLKTFTGHSPLIEDINLRELNKALSDGHFTLNLDMEIPFKTPDAKPDISGNIEFDGVTLKSDISRIELNDLSGSIDFTGGSFSGSGLTATFNGRPVTLRADGSKVGEVSNTTITLSGEADNLFVADQIQYYLPESPLQKQLILDKLSGSLQWEATLQYHKPAGEQKLQRSIVLESDLKGMAIALPEPLGKIPGSEKPLRVFRRLDDSVPPVIQLTYGDDLSAELMLSVEDGISTLQDAHFHFGSGPKTSTSDGMYISGDINSLSVSEWWDFLQETDRNSAEQSELPLYIDLDIANLHLLSQHFSGVKLSIRDSNDTWILDTDSEAIAGRIILPDPVTRNTLASIDLERLHLQRIEQDRHTELNPHALPALRADIKDFRYDGKELGALELAASPSNEGMAFDTITFLKPGLTIHGEGKWASTGNTVRSSFSIEVHADKIDTMLKTFGYDVTTIKNGETNLLIQADWDGTPMQFSLEKLNGNISMQVRKGQLLNVEPAAGRLFGLLSVQALPRRLTLDFRDLFSKGLAFDIIEGNFVVTNGNAYTNDLFMRGPAVDVTISGRTGLSEKDYDQRVTVTPQVSESLPIAGAIFGPVGIGIGAIFYIAGEMFESLRTNIDSLLRYQYTITGSWEDPVVEKINPTQEASG